MVLKVIFTITRTVLPLLTIIFVYLILLGYVKTRSPKLDAKNINIIGKKCLKLFNIKDEVRFQILKNVKCSNAGYKEEENYYLVKIKDSYLDKRISTIIHELTHIEKGHAYLAGIAKKSIFNIIKFGLLNIFYDSFFAWPNEIKYSKWIRENFS